MLAKIYYYQNFNIPSGFDSLEVMVWGMFAGIMLGVVFSTFDKLFCQRMVGDYYNVMGLPVCALYECLKELAPTLMEEGSL